MSAIDAFCGAVANMQRAYRIADAAVLADIESEGQRMALPPGWIDIAALTNPAEHSAEVIDMATESLAYAEWRGLIERHPTLAGLVRIVRRHGRCATD